MKTLHISNDLSLPIEAVTQTFGIVARKRVGKTYTASVFAEELIKAGVPVVIIDPTGAWHGLRSSADGKRDGLPVIIIGGAHGDVPLEYTAGKVIADLVVEHPGYYVIDLSLTESNAQQDRFAMEFGERLYRAKESKRFPMQLIIDEADAVAPQRPQDGQQRMLGAYETIVRRGGIRGIGVTMITQRPAVLNKNILTQCECLILLQMTGPQDIAAVEDWIKYNGTPEEREKILSTLSKLQKGEAWIYSPSWLQILKKIRIRKRETFNSSATPEAGEPVVVPKMAKIDLDFLTESIKATIETAKANDPAVLKKQIAELQKDVAALSRATAVPPDLIDTLRDIQTEIGNQNARIESLLIALEENPETVRRVPHKPVAALKYKVETVYAANPSVEVVNRKSGEEVSLPDGQRKILTALAQYGAAMDREHIGIATSYKRSTRDAYLQRLMGSEYVETCGDLIRITGKGQRALGKFDLLPQGEELAKHYFQTLPDGESTILQCLIRAGENEGMERDKISEFTGYKRSTRDAYIQRLKTRKLVSCIGGLVIPSTHLFG